MTEHSILIRKIDDVRKPRLKTGAIFKEDSRNLDFVHSDRMAARAQPPLPITDVNWPRHIKIMNQNASVTVNGRRYNGLGSCVPNSGITTLSTGPFKPPYPRPTEQKTIVPLYETLSAELGPEYAFPPNDKGCSIGDFMSLAIERGWISEYNWVYTLDDMLQALMHGPVQVAIAYLHSYERDASSARFPVHLKSGIISFHALCADEVRLSKKQVWYTNSWGHVGARDAKGNWTGKFYQTFTDLERLFKSNNIQVAVPIPSPTRRV